MNEEFFQSIAKMVSNQMMSSQTIPGFGSCQKKEGEGSECTFHQQGAELFSGSEFASDMKKMVMDTVMKSVSEQISAKVAQSMMGDIPQEHVQKNEPDKKDSESAALLGALYRDIDNLLCELLGRVSTLLDLSAKGHLIKSDFEKELKVARHDFTSRYQEILKKKDWRLGFLQTGK